MKVVLDPGHGMGDNRGAGNGYSEGTAMFRYAGMLAARLRERGMEVIITRGKAEDDPSLTARGKTAAGAELFLSLHTNAASSPAACGVSVFYSVKRPGDRDMAETFSRGLAGVIRGGTRDRGAQTRQSTKGDWDYYTVIQKAAETDCPHILLVEHGFHSHPEECAWLAEDANLAAMADRETELIASALGADKLEQGWARGADRRWRYYAPDGKLLCSQWLLHNGLWYRLMEDGTMAEGWAKVGGKWYYMTPETGEMVTGERVIDGEKHTFDGEGVWKNG